MKVEYIKCDICDQRILTGKKTYRYSYIVCCLDVAMTESLDICDECFDRLKKWTKQEIAKKKEAKDGPST